MIGSNSNRIRNRAPREIPRVIVGKVVGMVVALEVEVGVEVSVRIIIVISKHVQSINFVNHACMDYRQRTGGKYQQLWCNW